MFISTIADQKEGILAIHLQFDNAVAPVLFDQLIETTGAKSIDWSLKLECCGAPLLGVNDELSMDLTERKLADGKTSGADYLCVGCPWCQVQFDSVQEMMTSVRGTNHHLPSILYPQLLGLAMGINGETLGIKMLHCCLLPPTALKH